MYRSQSQPSGDPATMSGQILLGIGMGLFAIAIPCAAVVSRRSLFVLMPVAALLIIIGSLLLPGSADQLLRHLRSALTRPLVLIPLLLLIWAGLSFIWTPFPAQAIERYLKTTGTVLVAAIAMACLPARMKPSYANLLPIGVAVAALATAAVSLMWLNAPQPPESDGGDTLRRAVAGLVVLLWPALAVLALRERLAAAGLLGAAVAGAALLVRAPISLSALIIAIAIFSAGYAAPARTAKAIGAALAGLMVGAPLLVLALDPLVARMDPVGLFGMFHLWADIVKSEGVKLVTGHGFDTAGRALAAGLLPAGAPRGILFEIWYELGLVGAVATALLMWSAFTGAARMGRATGSFVMAGMAAVLTISIVGVSISQLWWTTQLAGVALAFATAARTQTRAETTRAPAFNQRPVMKI
jgi:hypothetical protein